MLANTVGVSAKKKRIKVQIILEKRQEKLYNKGKKT
jgi:hypothetical protein